MRTMIYLAILFATLFILNILIFSTRRNRRQLSKLEKQEQLSDSDQLVEEEIVAVRKITDEGTDKTSQQAMRTSSETHADHVERLIVIQVFAKNEQKFSGYELLQALLAAGMRFGEMNIFHRYQDKQGKGPVLFSLACATEPGTFDIKKIRETHCSGLSLFMRISNYPNIDLDRYDLMHETAKQLAKTLNGELRDIDRRVLGDQIVQQHRKQIQEMRVTDEEFV